MRAGFCSSLADSDLSSEKLQFSHRNQGEVSELLHSGKEDDCIDNRVGWDTVVDQDGIRKPILIFTQDMSDWIRIPVPGKYNAKPKQPNTIRDVKDKIRQRQ